MFEETVLKYNLEDLRILKIVISVKIGATMMEIFLEAPIELKLMMLGAIGAAFIAVAYNGIRGTDETIRFNNHFNR